MAYTGKGDPHHLLSEMILQVAPQCHGNRALLTLCYPFYLPSLKLAKMDGWKTIVSLLDGFLSSWKLKGFRERIRVMGTCCSTGLDFLTFQRASPLRFRLESVKDIKDRKKPSWSRVQLLASVTWAKKKRPPGCVGYIYINRYKELGI